MKNPEETKSAGMSNNKVNGETTVDDDFATTPDKKPMAAEGIIALQIHAGFPKMRVEFKDIKFTDLSKK